MRILLEDVRIPTFEGDWGASAMEQEARHREWIDIDFDGHACQHCTTHGSGDTHSARPFGTCVLFTPPFDLKGVAPDSFRRGDSSPVLWLI